MSKTLYIDADSLLYLTVMARENTGSSFDVVEGESDDFGTVALDMKDLKRQFKKKLQDVIDSCELDSAIGNMTKFKDVVCVFTGHTNFRYDIFPDYKWSRIDTVKPPEFKKLKTWAIKKFGIVSELVEADDIVSYYSSKGHPIASADKDVLYNCPGYHYDMYHRNFKTTTKDEAAIFLAVQSINGDPTADCIPGIRTPKANKYKGDKTKAETPITKANPNGVGISRVGPTKADTLLNKDYTWSKVIQIYLDHNFSREYAITQIRLVHMHQIKKIKKNGEIKLKMFKI